MARANRQQLTRERLNPNCTGVMRRRGAAECAIVGAMMRSPENATGFRRTPTCPPGQVSSVASGRGPQNGDATMRISTRRMYERMLASDATYNGHFFTGVMTTGIYCLPACRARKPKPENVRFFPTCEAARAAGLRPCRKCHPDDFERGADPVLESIEALVVEMRAAPAKFADVRAVIQRSGFGATRLSELFRLHYHQSPSDLLNAARLAQARSLLLSTGRPLTEIAAEVGYESLSVFHDQFRRHTGMTPAAYRGLKSCRTFSLAVDPSHSWAYLRRALSRDPQSVSERLVCDTYTAAVLLSTGPALLTLQLRPGRADAELSGGTAAEAHRVVSGLLGLGQNTAAFCRHVSKLGLGRLVSGRDGLCITQTTSVFDGLVWSILGQQVNFAFACTLKRRLTEMVGQRLTDGLIAPPSPEAVAALDARDLAAQQFSTRKAEYLVNVARLVVNSELRLDALADMSATRVERTLLSIRGLGPWSVNYVMMRSLGFSDCLPLGDTGVTSGLQALFKLDKRPDADATRHLMAPFSPFRSLATTHLWQYLQPVPS